MKAFVRFVLFIRSDSQNYLTSSQMIEFLNEVKTYFVVFVYRYLHSRNLVVKCLEFVILCGRSLKAEF